MALLFTAAGWCLGYHAEPPAPAPMPQWLAASLKQPKLPAVRVIGQTVAVSGKYANRLEIILDHVHPAAGGDFLPGRVALTLSSPAMHPLPGQILEADLKIRPVHDFQNGLVRQHFADSFYAKGVYYQAWQSRNAVLQYHGGVPDYSSTMREKLRAGIVACFAQKSQPAQYSREPAQGWSLLPALLFGDRSFLQTADIQRLQAAGLAHSIALSGQHLAIAGLFGTCLVLLAGMLIPGIFLHLPRSKLLPVLTLPGIFLYLWLGNAPPSLVRAALMTLFWAVFFWMDRASAFPDALVATAACMLIVSPLAMYDIGVQLSFSAVAGIILLMPLLRRLWRINHNPRFWQRILCLFWTSLACSLAAQMATWSLVMRTFGYSTWWFPLNLLWLPVLGFFVLPAAFLGLVIYAAGFPMLASLCLHGASIPCDILLHGLFWLEIYCGMDVNYGLRPHWTALAGYACLFVALAMLQGRSAQIWQNKVIVLQSWKNFYQNAMLRILLAAILLLMIAPCMRLLAERNPNICITIPDVGQGQAVLLEWNKGNGQRGRALIDAGGASGERFNIGQRVLAPILADNHAPDLDFIVVSHPDQDHIGGFLFLAKYFAIKKAYTCSFAAMKKSSLARSFLYLLQKQHISRTILYKGERIPLKSSVCPGLFLEVIAPAINQTAKGNNGLVLRLVYKDKGLVFLPGDADTEWLQQIIRDTLPDRLQSAILVVPHHGSASSLLPAFYDAVKPDTAVISSGAYNVYGHPHAAVVDALAHRHIHIHNTAKDGIFVKNWNPAAF